MEVAGELLAHLFAGRAHADVNGSGGSQTYIKIMPGRPRHKSPTETAPASPGWGRFFAADRSARVSRAGGKVVCYR
jgi:hypothetical protein